MAELVRKWSYRVLRSSLCVATITVFHFAPLTAAREDVTLRQVLEHMARSYEELSSLQTHFTLVKSYPQLDITDPPERGLIYMKRRGRGRSIRLEVREPEKRILTIKNGNYVLYQPKIKQAIEGKLAGNGNAGGAGFLSYLFGDLSDAKKDYDIVLLGEQKIDENQAVHIRLTAKASSRGLYRRVDLWVDAHHWIPIRQELVELNQSITTLRFHDIRTNVDVEDSLFDIKLPPGVERVRGQ